VKLLLDHCVPKRFGRLLKTHEVRTAFEMGWEGKKNGQLLMLASSQFHAFLTVDQNLRYQQNLKILPLPVCVLLTPDNRFETLEPYAAVVLGWLAKPIAVGLYEIDLDGEIRLVGKSPT
jgi:hypothetical protein